MVFNDIDSELLKTFISVINLFNIAARFVVFIKIVKYIRNIDNRKSIVSL